jgi:hypothetical protein
MTRQDTFAPVVVLGKGLGSRGKCGHDRQEEHEEICSSLPSTHPFLSDLSWQARWHLNSRIKD